jgi:hypothetical protein
MRLSLRELTARGCRDCCLSCRHCSCARSGSAGLSYGTPIRRFSLVPNLSRRNRTNPYRRYVNPPSRKPWNTTVRIWACNDNATQSVLGVRLLGVPVPTARDVGNRPYGIGRHIQHSAGTACRTPRPVQAARGASSASTPRSRIRTFAWRRSSRLCRRTSAFELSPCAPGSGGAVER